MEITLALDISTTAVGWCWATGSEYLTSGRYRPKAGNVNLEIDHVPHREGGTDAWLRILDIYRWLEHQLDEIVALPDVILVEEPTGKRGNPRTDRLLGAVIGMVAVIALHKGAELRLVHPKTAKATGIHKDALDEAMALTGKDEMTGDEADAIGIWLAYVTEERIENATS